MARNQHTQILCSSKHGDIAGVQRQIDLGVSVNYKLPDDDDTPLVVAARSASAGVEMLAFLVANGADIGGTPGIDALHAAAGAHRREKVAYLVSAGVRPNRTSREGYNAFECAAYGSREGRLNMFDQLYQLDIDISCQTHRGSALSATSYQSDFTSVRWLIDHGADAAQLQWSELHRAIALGSMADVRRELGRNADLTARDRWDRTPFLLSVCTGEINRASLLLDAGGNMSDRGRCGKPLLAHAADQDYADMVRWLIDRGADVVATDEMGSPAIVHAVKADATACVRQLIAAGAPIQGVAEAEPRVEKLMHEMVADLMGVDEAAALLDNLGSMFGPDVFSLRQSPWFAVTSATSIDTIRVLLDAGASINQVDEAGHGLLKTAAEQDSPTMVRALLDMGADPKATSTCGKALHSAVLVDGLEVAQMLLAHGADPNAQDVDGWTPLFFVRSAEMARLLLDAGCDPAIGNDLGPKHRAVKHIRDPFVRAVITNR